MGRILAIDYGRKRVGLAVTDPMQIIANRLETVRAHDIFDYLTSYFAENDVEKVIVGYPTTLKNEPSESIQFVNPFLKRFQKLYPDMPLQLMDERFTSVIAQQTMIDAGLKKKDRQNKGLVDGIAATVILQGYLEQQRFKF